MTADDDLKNRIAAMRVNILRIGHDLVRLHKLERHRKCMDVEIDTVRKQIDDQVRTTARMDDALELLIPQANTDA